LKHGWLLRQYSPDIIALRLNQRPRQTLGFETLVSRLQAGFALTQVQVHSQFALCPPDQ